MKADKEKTEDIVEEGIDEAPFLGTYIKENKPLVYVGGGQNTISIKVDKEGNTSIEMKPNESRPIPTQLTTPEATDLLQRLQKAGFLDENLQPLNLSRAKIAIMAHFIADVLLIKNMWTIFGEWWNINAISSAYNKGMKQAEIADFLSALNKV